MARDYGTNTFVWNTTGLSAGTYRISVHARAIGSTAYLEAESIQNYALGACTATSFTAAPPSPSSIGTSVTLTASATGCASADFKWWVRPPGGNWTVLRDWGGNTFNWNTTGLAGGTYALGAWARVNESTATFDASSEAPYDLGSCTATGFTAQPPSPSSIGTTVNLTATASGCANAEFKWWVLPQGGSWTVLRDWGGNTYSWDTTGSGPGTYQLGVWARVIGSNGYDASSEQPYNLGP
jgi:hypothetical protein